MCHKIQCEEKFETFYKIFGEVNKTLVEPERDRRNVNVSESISGKKASFSFPRTQALFSSPKHFSRFSVTLNFAVHVWSIKYK
jgi:hypothetical protein